MTRDEWDKRLDEIVDRINEIKNEIEDAGETFIELVIDVREDNDLPPFTLEELEAAKKQCNKAAEIDQALEAEERELIDEYYILAGRAPHYYDLTGTVARNWHDEFSGEG